MSQSQQAPSERTRLKRLHGKGSHEPEVIRNIIDATCECSVGYVFDGMPYVTPTLHWREGDRIYWHGSSASRMLRSCSEADVCLAISILDGFVMARSGMHHSVNARSVMLFGRAARVAPEEKEARLKAFIDGLFPGRWDMLRPVTSQELKATMILSMPISEASAKLRSGPPGDDEEDYALPIWAGEIPVRRVTGQLVDDPRNLDGVGPPENVTGFSLFGRTG